MRHCSACDCQLPDEQESCPHCGAAAQPGADMVLLASMDPFESRRLLDRLAEAGIPFAVVNDEAARRVSRGRAGGFAGVNILVPLDQHTAAGEIQQAVLRESLPGLAEDFEPPSDGAEVCPACATPLAGDAQRCEECGLEFPDVGA